MQYTCLDVAGHCQNLIMGVDKIILLLIVKLILIMNEVNAQEQNIDSLPNDLNESLQNFFNEYLLLDKKYNINYFTNHNSRFYIEELDSNEFTKPLSLITPNGDCMLVDYMPFVIRSLYQLFPENNYTIPEQYKNKIVKVVNVSTGRFKSDVLHEILSKYNLLLEESKYAAQVLELDFNSFNGQDIPEIDSISFNSLNGYMEDSISYLKDFNSSELEYHYYFMTKHQLKTINSDDVVLPYIKLDVSTKEKLDEQLKKLFHKSRFVEVEQDFITISER